VGDLTRGALTPEDVVDAVLVREGLTRAALTKALHRPEAEVARILENAQAYLLQHLVESDCRLKKSDPSAREARGT